MVFGSVAYFFQGGGWNQNAHFATTVALVEDRTLAIDRFRDSTGDLASAGGNAYSVKAVGTAIACVPGYVVARALTAGIDNAGNRAIARAYLTTVLGPGIALALFAVVLFRAFRRRLADRDAALLSLAVTLATPLFPNSTMVSSAPFVALFAFWSYQSLEAVRLGLCRATPGRVLLTGFAAALPTAFEYTAAVILVPLCAYAWDTLPPPRRLRLTPWFAAGVGLAALAPMLHHQLAYGSPFRLGYESMVNAGMATSAGRGFFGFDGFSWARLYDLTLGDARGFVFMSPFLAAAVPGSVRLLSVRATRAEGLVSAALVYGVIVLVACLSYWHSGWGLGSRYALLSLVFAGVPIAAVLPRHRAWIGAAVLVGFVTMALAVAVTATPPPPGRRPPRMPITGWLWENFAADNIAHHQERVLVDRDAPDATPTWRPSFNLGELFGLAGKTSVLPWLMFVGAAGVALFRAAGARPMTEAERRSPA
ncbi:MAG: hypothetical protein HY903_01995 [Deltaproteobacteria bacterium]|nr:hypothetical protein [Deltaproteobacteria bacterium]